MKGSRILLDVLHDEGVRHVFGNPGTTELPLIAELSRSTGPAYVLGLQESVVVAMADGYAQASGRPAMVNLHAMAGLGNAIGNLTNARVQGTPLVVTAGQADQRHLVSDPLLAGDLTGLAAPVSKWTHEVRRVEDLDVVMRRAFRDAASAPTGPVFVSLPVDVLEADAPDDGAAARHAVSELDRAPHGAPVAQLAELLLETDPGRLAIVASDDVATEQAVEELVGVAEALGVRVYGSSLHANTVFPTGHPLWAGGFGLSAGDIRATLAGYDRVLVLGGRAFMAYNYSPGPLVPPEVELLQIALDPHSLGRTAPVRLGLVGHLRTTLGDLRKVLAERGDPNRARAAMTELGTVHRAALDAAEAHALGSYSQVPTAPAAAVHAVFRALPPDIVVVDESMTCDDYVRAFHRADRPGQYYTARGSGLGWGMPAALGVSLARGHEPVLCLVGDGSAMYSPQALWTAAREQLPVLFVVVNNSQYLMLKNSLHHRYPEFGNGDRFVGMDIDHPAIDFVALARSMGVRAERVERATDIAEAARAAWDSGGPRVLELPISAP
ncbi:thiamine pyrophosphate-binding protein [Streptomyces sp. CBMA123]|uniref:thiamine pyrophosphate-binding protein n=1 Tax=Streptomyces sp. CBMA123 TaxID=1896313 RepID=UPI001661EBAB|nr:thiamine pyrophosphate-binding protein [Streptomyces sp. CBMA123]